MVPPDKERAVKAPNCLQRSKSTSTRARNFYSLKQILLKSSLVKIREAPERASAEK